MTSTPDKSRLQNAMSAACEVAKQQGLKFDEAIALQDRSNLVIKAKKKYVAIAVYLIAL